MSRLAPLPADTIPELREAFVQYEKSLGFVPNSVLIMQRRPKMVKALAQLAAAVWDPPRSATKCSPPCASTGARTRWWRSSA